MQILLIVLIVGYDAALKIMGFLSKSLLRLTHPKKYKILLSFSGKLKLITALTLASNQGSYSWD
ncbi:exonuclease [Aphanothece sacrum FPU3]|nr:exonuclease [Aphanothece sacrum FPU3]